MKKVLAIVLALAMILGSFSFVAAGASTEYSDTEGTKYEGAVAVLGALDIVAGYPDGTYKPEKVVTRAEMCKLVIAALNMSDYVAGSYAGFPDVPGSHWASSYIAYATSLGVIQGYPDGTFRPENPVTYQEAASMLVRALGYEDEYLVGTWPASHVNVAMSEGILDGVVATAAGANRGDIALMFYNALTRPMVKYNTLGDLQNMASMLSRLGAVKVENAIIDEQLAHDAQKNIGIDIDKYIGAYVDYYWLNADKTDDPATGPVYKANKGDGIIAIAKEKSTFLTGEYKANGTEPDTFVVGDTVYKFKGNAGAIDTYGATPTDHESFYNGVEVTEKSVTWGPGLLTAAVKLNGIYIDEVYSIAKTEACAEIKWDEDYADILASKDKIANHGFAMNNQAEIDYSWLTLVGVEDLASIPEGAIVTLYDKTIANDTADIVKVGVSTDSVVGKVTKVETKGTKTFYTIGEASYEAANPAVDYDKNATPAVLPGLGDNGTFFLNHKGQLSAYKADDATGNYAIVLQAAAPKVAYGSEDVYQIYLLTKDGEKTVYDFAKKDYAIANTRSIAEGDMVEFKTNADGKVTIIQEVAYTGNAAATLTDKGVMDGKLISEDAIVFNLTSSATETKDWKVGDLAELKTGNDFATATIKNVYYDVNAKTGKVDVIVVTNGSNAVKAVTNMGIFTSNYTTYNAKDEQIFGGTVLTGGASVDYLTTADITANTQVADRDEFYTLTYKNGSISAIGATTAVPAANPRVESAFAAGEYTLYNGGYATDAKQISGDLINMYKVIKKSGSTLDLGQAAKGTVANYQYIGDAANVYKIALKDDNTFKGLEIGSVSEITKDSYVILLQMDKKSGAWDTIIYITDTDAAVAPLAAN